MERQVWGSCLKLGEGGNVIIRRWPCGELFDCLLHLLSYNCHLLSLVGLAIMGTFGNSGLHIQIMEQNLSISEIVCHDTTHIPGVAILQFQTDDSSFQHIYAVTTFILEVIFPI